MTGFVISQGALYTAVESEQQKDFEWEDISKYEAIMSLNEDKIRVLIVDDHQVVRQGLRTFLELQDLDALPIEVVDDAANGIEVVELARRTQPDIVLLDLVMPEMDGIQAMSKIIEWRGSTAS